MKKLLLTLACEVLLLCACTLSVQAPAPAAEGDGEGRYIYEDGARHMGGDGEPIRLVNNPRAQDPTYDQLTTFLAADLTDTRPYIQSGEGNGFVCGDFAEVVHNNAERAGIRAGWVSISFGGESIGHACNAFQTLDRGLVYVDCTGRNPALHVQSRSGNGNGGPLSWDKVAYIEKGQEYGLVGLERAGSPAYQFYEGFRQTWREYRRQLQAYNDEVMRFNQEIAGQTYYEGSAELARIREWEASLKDKEVDLNRLGEAVGEYWFEPLGVVEKVSVFW